MGIKKSFRILILSSLIMSPLLFMEQALAKSSYPNNIDSAAKNLYGTDAGFPFSCNVCHGSNYSIQSTGTLFGKDFYAGAQDNGYSPSSLSSSQIQNVIKYLETVDSDNDGASLKQELIASTNPNDSSSFPPPQLGCTPGTPTLNLDPPQQSGDAGSTLSYSLSIMNNDTTDCPPTSMNLQASSDSALSTELVNQSIVLDPGQSTIINIKVSSNASAGAGNYTFQAKAINGNDTSLMATASGMYGVNAAPTPTPTPTPAPVCTPAAASVEISPNSQSGYAGDTLTYTATVTNHDSKDCESTDFSMAFSAPESLAIQLSATTVKLAPSQSQTLQVKVMSATDAAAQQLQWALSTTDGNAELHSAQALATYVVKLPVAQGEILPPTDLVVKRRHHKVVLKWKGPESDQVSKFRIYLDGKAIGETTAEQIRLRLKRGQHLLQVTSLDNNGNESALSDGVEVEVQRRRFHKRRRHRKSEYHRKGDRDEDENEDH